MKTYNVRIILLQKNPSLGGSPYLKRIVRILSNPNIFVPIGTVYIEDLLNDEYNTDSGWLGMKQTVIVELIDGSFWISELHWWQMIFTV